MILLIEYFLQKIPHKSKSSITITVNMLILFKINIINYYINRLFFQKISKERIAPQKDKPCTSKDALSTGEYNALDRSPKAILSNMINVIILFISMDLAF